MSKLDHSNITDYFLQLVGIPKEDFSRQDIIESSAEYVENLIIPEMLTQPQKDRCEYAAAVHGVYEYILTRSLTEKIVITQSGKAVYDSHDEGALSAAFALKKSVFASMKDLIRDNGFCFTSAGGI